MMRMNDPVTRRDVMAAAAAGAVLAATRGAAQARDDDLTKLSIEEASRRIAARDLSPVELTRAYLERIERVDDDVNSYITVLAEQALAQARALEDELARGQRRGPLHGIPLGAEGQHRHGRHSHDGRERRVRRPDPERGRRVRAQAARRGRRVPRQAEHARVRVRRHVGRHALRARAQSVESRPPPRRLVRRLGAPPSRRGSAPPRSAPTRPRPSVIRPRAAASWGSKRRTASRAFAASCRCRNSMITSGRSRAASQTARS